MRSFYSFMHMSLFWLFTSFFTIPFWNYSVPLCFSSSTQIFTHVCVTSSHSLRSYQPRKTAPVPFPTLRQQKLLPEISEELPPLDFKRVLHILFSVKNLEKQMKIRSVNIKRLYCCDTGHRNLEISPQTTDCKSVFYCLEKESMNKCSNPLKHS